MLELLKEDLVTTEVDPEVKKQAFVAAVNDLTQKAWAFISDVQSVKTTFETDYEGSDLEAVKALLESVEDDITVSVGVLTKLTSILDNSSATLVDAGEEKADAILNGEQEAPEE